MQIVNEYNELLATQLENQKMVITANGFHFKHVFFFFWVVSLNLSNFTLHCD